MTSNRSRSRKMPKNPGIAPLPALILVNSAPSGRNKILLREKSGVPAKFPLPLGPWQVTQNFS